MRPLFLCLSMLLFGAMFAQNDTVFVTYSNANFQSLPESNNKRVSVLEHELKKSNQLADNKMKALVLNETTRATAAEATKATIVGLNVAMSFAWQRAGNAGTTGDFFGTTNNIDLVFKKNNVQLFRTLGSGLYLGATSNGGAGVGSIASGTYANASGQNSIAFCNYCGVTGSNSMFLGANGNVSGNSSLLVGTGTLTGNNSLIVGTGSNSGFGSISVSSKVSGWQSVGIGGTVKAAFAFNVGMNNDTSDVVSPSVTALTDRVFQIGNGVSTTSLSNAVTVLRNGNVSIGSSYVPTEKLEVSGRIKAQNLRLTSIPIFETDNQATTLLQGDVYRTSLGVLMIKL